MSFYFFALERFEEKKGGKKICYCPCRLITSTYCVTCHSSFLMNPQRNQYAFRSATYVLNTGSQIIWKKLNVLQLKVSCPYPGIDTSTVVHYCSSFTKDGKGEGGSSEENRIVGLIVGTCRRVKRTLTWHRHRIGIPNHCKATHTSSR